LHANLKNDLDAVREVRQLMGEIRDAWAQVPDLIEGQVAVNFG
jgi:flagellin-specific chaperone FliS